MLDYDREADHYDRSRGGEARAAAAAAAIEQLLPDRTRLLLDLACGTGIVTTRLRRPDRTVLGIDASAGMLNRAAHRLPGRVARGDGASLPLASGSLDAVVMIWLLHLVPNAEELIAEAARVLRQGGRLITTVDKNDGPFAPASDLAEVTRALRRRTRPDEADGLDRVRTAASRHGLQLVGEGSFIGWGQGQTPRQWIDRIQTGAIPWARGPVAEQLGRTLAALPDQDRPRPAPVYRLIAVGRPDA